MKRPHNDLDRRALADWSRRDFLTSTACGLGLAGLGSVLAADGRAASVTDPLSPRQPHFAPTAKNCIFIFMEGGSSEIDLFDPKPKVNELHGQPMPDSLLEGVRFAFIQPDSATLMGSPRTFTRHGECGMDFSDLLPNIASCADDILMVRSLHGDQFNHHPGQLMMQTGHPNLGFPSMGSWILYGLGTESQNMPGYVVLTSGQPAAGGATLYQSGFLPSNYSGVLFREQGDPILDLGNPSGLPRELQQHRIDTVNQMNQRRFDTVRDPEIAARIANYELAFRMQMAAPEVLDIDREPDFIREMYGVDRSEPSGMGGRGKRGNTHQSFARNCLLARRMVEHGVRFVNIIYSRWDHHSRINEELPYNCSVVDQPFAALIRDLKMRGMLDDTLVVWGTEFGRTPLGENRPGFDQATGRDHHPFSFTNLLAGGGIQGGRIYGETDEIGWGVIRDPVDIHDFHATLLHLFGLGHEDHTFRFRGRDYRLTDVGGRVIPGWT